jgi:glycosyltransferase involved in cell wall biosynthesis
MMRLRRPSIVHLTTFLQGGAGRAITDLACAQHARGWDVLVVSSATGEGAYGNYPHYVERLAHQGIPVALEDSLFKRDAALNQRVLDRLSSLRDPNSVDIVHAHAATPARIGLQFAAHGSDRAAVIQTQHGWGTNKTPQQAQDDLAVLQDVARVVVTSQATASFLELRGIRAHHIATIPCGLPAALPPPPRDEVRQRIEDLRRRGHRIVGCVGTVTANKNQNAIVEALELLALDKVTVVFAGEGSAALLDDARALGVQDRVVALGYHGEAERLMPLFDLLVVPSRTEGQGLVVLEAFRANVPVLASDIPAFRSLVAHNRTGWRFALEEPQALAEAIQRSLLVSPDERARITAAARRTFQQSFTADVMVEQHERLYASLTRRTGLRVA